MSEKNRTSHDVSIPSQVTKDIRTSELPPRLAADGDHVREGNSVTKTRRRAPKLRLTKEVDAARAYYQTDPASVYNGEIKPDSDLSVTVFYSEDGNGAMMVGNNEPWVLAFAYDPSSRTITSSVLVDDQSLSGVGAHWSAVVNWVE